MTLLSCPLVLCGPVLSFFVSQSPSSFHTLKDLGVIPLTKQPLLAHLRICHLHGQKGSALQQPPPDDKAQVIGPLSPHSNQLLLPSMEKRGRETVVTSKRRKEAGRSSPGMWGREAEEAAVWEAASPRGRRPAH